MTKRQNLKTLVEEQKDERRARILSSVRKLVQERGYESLTIRSLADAARVSVPTLYSWFGGKDELLFAAVEEQFTQMFVAARMLPIERGVERVFFVLSACNSFLLAEPNYSKTLLGLFTSATAGARPILSEITAGLAAQLEEALRVAQRRRELAPWFAPNVVAETLRDQYLMTAMRWGTGELSDAQLRARSEYSASLTLGSVAGKRLATELRNRALAAQKLCS